MNRFNKLTKILLLLCLPVDMKQQSHKSKNNFWHAYKTIIFNVQKLLHVNLSTDISQKFQRR